MSSARVEKVASGTWWLEPTAESELKPALVAEGLKVDAGQILFSDSEKAQLELKVGSKVLTLSTGVYLLKSNSMGELTPYPLLKPKEDSAAKVGPPPDPLPGPLPGNPLQGSEMPPIDSRTEAPVLFAKQVESEVQSLQRCYARALAMGPLQSGQVGLEIELLSSGRVQRVSIQKTDFDSEDFHSCLISAVQRIQVSEFKGDPIIMTFPLSFE